jgi:peptidoglycan/LPS O-acetylase OafA/YrhL
MENLDPFIFGALIFGGGATMMAFHWDKNFRLKFQQQTEEESRFYQRQYMRRMVTSGLIAWVGILFMVYRFLPDKSILRIWVIAVVLLLVGVLLILALVDFASLRKLQKIQSGATAKATRDLADELKRLRTEANDQKRKSANNETSEQ